MSSKNSVFFSQPISTAVHDTSNSSKSLGGAKFHISFPFLSVNCPFMSSSSFLNNLFFRSISQQQTMTYNSPTPITNPIILSIGVTPDNSCLLS